MPRPACPKCGNVECSRVKREGLLQVLVLPRFGRFPWKCSSCGRTFLVKERGKSKRNHPGEPTRASSSTAKAQTPTLTEEEHRS